MRKIRITLWLLFLGICASSALGLLAFTVFPHSLATTFYLWPGFQAAPILATIIPTTVVYWLVPDGGGLAFVLLTFISAFTFWAMLFAAALLASRAWWPNKSFKADGSAAA